MTSLDIHHLEAMALADSAIHRLDARTKLITTLLFVVVVATHDKYDIVGLTPFFLYPLVLLGQSGVSAGYVGRKLLLVSPFAVLLGMANPFFDATPMLVVAGIPLSGGWVSFVAILLRFLLAISALILLIATTGMMPICQAAGRLGVPGPFVVQLLLLHRYLFLLVEEASRISRARALRSFQGRGMDLATHARIIGHLLLRTLGRGSRIHQAMLLRGFDGDIRLTAATTPLRRQDWNFLLGWGLAFVLLRLLPVAAWLGHWLTGGGGWG